MNAALKLQPQANRVLGSWWAMASKDYFEKLVIVFKGVVGFIIRGQKIPENKVSVMMIKRSVKIVFFLLDSFLRSLFACNVRYDGVFK